MKNRKMLLITICGVLVLALLIITAIIIFNKKQSNKTVYEEINVEQLKSNFNGMFDNEKNDYVSTLYYINEKKSGKYEIDAYVPCVHISDQIDNKINKEINDIFMQKLLQIYNESKSYNVFKMYYASSVNNNIISLAIKCILKDGNNAQRTIIKTYNYDIENEKLIKITDLIPESKREGIQEKINQEIKTIIKKYETISNQGYNIYKRDENSNMYILENATEFYINDNILYIIYSYGNSNYTSEVDLIIDKLENGG